MPKTFKHSGDMGDIIYSLPTIRAMGGGVLYMDPEGGLKSPLVKWVGRDRTKLCAATIESAMPLLRLQPYLEDVRFWRGEQVEFDLDTFRLNIRFNNLADSHLAAFNLPLTERDTPWLRVDSPISIPNRPSNIKIHAELERMRPHADGVHFVVALVLDPVVNHVGGEDIAFEKEIVIVLQFVAGLFQ
jgi:hypothetical protein